MYEKHPIDSSMPTYVKFYMKAPYWFKQKVCVRWSFGKMAAEKEKWINKTEIFD